MSRMSRNRKGIRGIVEDKVEGSGVSFAIVFAVLLVVLGLLWWIT